LVYARLIGAVCEDAALRRRQRLQPVGGKGDKIFPRTYPPSDEMKRLLGDRSAPPRHVFERRRVDGTEVWCVLVDGMQKPASARSVETACAMAYALPYFYGPSWRERLLLKDRIFQ
jgi:CRISPR-associated protein Csb1